MVSRGRGDGRQRGQALLEFALVLPIFAVALLGMIDIGRGIWANNAVANAAREAARYAAVHGGSCEDLASTGCTSANYCPVGPYSAPTVVPSASASCPYPSPSKQAIYNTATSFLIAGGSNTVITACYGSGCSGNTDTSGASNVRGTAVTVTVRSQVPMILGTLLGLGPINVSATSTMLVNH
jgi:hypothetical protein